MTSTTLPPPCPGSADAVPVQCGGVREDGRGWPLRGQEPGRTARGACDPATAHQPGARQRPRHSRRSVRGADSPELAYPISHFDHPVHQRPCPDLCLAAGERHAFAKRHPGPADIGLGVEVADSSLDSDRADKGRIYARDGIVEYWIVNIPDRQVEVYT